MAYQIEPAEPVGEALRRIVSECLESCIHSLAAAGDLEAAIHDARKRCKEIRAALKLLRGALPAQVFKRENAAVRDASRPLADIRDAYALVDAFDKLVKHAGKEISPRAAAAGRKILLDRRRDLRKKIVERGKVLPKTARELAAVQQRVPDWPVEQSGFKALRPGVERSYRDGLRAMKKAIKRPTVANWHEWRKRAKDLRHQLELLRPIGAKLIDKRLSLLEDLGDALGDDHDLSVLSQMLKPAGINDDARKVILRATEARRVELREKAQVLGRKAYSIHPEKFVRRIRAHWKKSRDASIPHA